MPNSPIKIVGIIGSLRKGSYTRKLAIEAQRLAPALGAEITFYDHIGLLPYVNEDQEKDYYTNNEDVKRYKQSIQQADAILFATPEYNFSLPGVLKNAIDIATRPANNNVLVGKPYGILSASPGVTGATRAQMAIRSTMFAFSGSATGWPEFVLPAAHKAFDESGKLHNEQSLKFLNSYLKTFIKLIEKEKNANTTPSTANTATDIGERKKQSKL